MLTRELPQLSIEDAFHRFASWPRVILFDSAKAGPTGRWSFLTADPVHVIERTDIAYGDVAWQEELRTWQAIGACASKIPFAGGLAGVLSYDLRYAFERLDTPAVDEFTLPVLSVGVYDWCLAWDHAENRCTLISTGITRDQTVSETFARERERDVLRTLEGPMPSEEGEHVGDAKSFGPKQLDIQQFAVPGFDRVTSHFTPESYRAAVEAMREHIAAGDIFQANLAQRLMTPQTTPSRTLYQRLRRVNPAPLAGYYDGGDWQLLSASPERFLEVTIDGEVETRPIKGTRPRKPGIEADLYTRDELRESDKDVAENVMIVDLLRNDLSRVCDPKTLRVPQLCEIETYQTVQHLVSSVRATLEHEHDVWDLIAGAFPGGSITGCPKIRAMDVITALEGVARGPYCGSMFYHSFNGRFDSSILIRTLIAADGWLQFPVGGGITYASDPSAEYQETIDKAVGLVRALSPAAP